VKLDLISTFYSEQRFLVGPTFVRGYLYDEYTDLLSWMYVPIGVFWSVTSVASGVIQIINASLPDRFL